MAQGYRDKNMLMKVKSIFELIETKYSEHEKFGFYTYNLLNTLLETFIRLQMKDHVLTILKYFLAREQRPRKFLLRVLGKMNFLPDDVYSVLNKFDYTTDNVSAKERTAFENEIPGSEKKVEEAVKTIFDGYKPKKKKHLF